MGQSGDRERERDIGREVVGRLVCLFFISFSPRHTNRLVTTSLQICVLWGRGRWAAFLEMKKTLAAHLPLPPAYAGQVGLQVSLRKQVITENQRIVEITK